MSSTPTPCLPTQSPANIAVPRPARPQQVMPSTSDRAPAGAAPQMQQQQQQLSQQQQLHWHAQQMKAYQQRLLEQQIFAQQKSFTSQPAAFSVAPYDRVDPPASSAALPYGVPATDAHHVQNVQEMLMQQMLYQQMYEAQQQQQMKSTVSAGAINLIQHQVSETGGVQQSNINSSRFRTLEADQMSAMRRASEGQVYTGASGVRGAPSAEPVDSAVHSVTCTQPHATDVIPTSTLTSTADNPASQSHDEMFKVPLPPDNVCFYMAISIIGPILWGHSSPLCHALLLLWTLPFTRCRYCRTPPVL